MRLIIDIKDEKASFLLELLRNFKFVKVKEVSSKNEKFLEEFKEAVEEVKQIRAGKKKGRNVQELLNEL